MLAHYKQINGMLHLYYNFQIAELKEIVQLLLKNDKEIFIELNDYPQ